MMDHELEREMNNQSQKSSTHQSEMKASLLPIVISASGRALEWCMWLATEKQIQTKSNAKLGIHMDHEVD